MSDELREKKREIIKRGLSSKKAAEYLGVARKTLDNYRSLQTGPHYWKFDNSIIYDPMDLDDYLDKSMRKVITVYYHADGMVGPFRGLLDDAN